jgi:flagellin-like protein
MNSRGISPLIATVVLIAFAVALGAVIMTWSARVIEAPENKTYECVDLSVGVYRYQTGEYDACYSDNSIVFTVESYRGKVSGLKLIAITTGKEIFSVPNVLKEPLVPNTPKKVVVPYSIEDYGNIKELKFFPMIGREPSLFVCDSNPFVLGTVPKCQ